MKKATTKLIVDEKGRLFKKLWLVGTRRNINKRDYFRLTGRKLSEIDLREMRRGRRLAQPCWTNIPYYEGHFRLGDLSKWRR